MTDKPAPTEIFKIRLRTARDELRRLSQSALAEKAGLPASSIAHFEAGSRKPSFDNLRRLADALDVTTDYLIGRVDDPAVSQAADPLFRHVSKLNDESRDIAKDFLEMLANREKDKRGN